MTHRLTSLLSLVLVLVLAFGAGYPLHGQTEEAAHTEELATYMGELQRLTHKLSLSTRARNPELAKFYLYESLIVLEDMQNNVPEYRGIPVAVYLDRFALPAYEPLKRLVESEKRPAQAQWDEATMTVIDSCNACHKATQFEFIKIQRNTHNPFPQRFELESQ